MQQPIIVMGMHRSGTSLLTRILEDFGVFMGENQDENSEALFFQDLNRWIFKQLGGRWDHPPNIDSLILNEKIHQLISKYLNQSIRGPKFIKYLGAKNYFLKIFKNNTDDFVWGWKDPRNVYTLPIWLNVFPEAKIIYIERHGVDVANSLMWRNQKSNQQAIDRFNKHNWLYHFYSKQAGFVNSLQCSSLNGGFSLWESYVKEAHKNLGRLTDTKFLSLKFEDLLTNPKQQINRISEFLDIKIPEKDMQELGDIRQMKAYSFQSNPDLKAFAEKVSDRLINY